jgi:hypothetical protein
MGVGREAGREAGIHKGDPRTTSAARKLLLAFAKPLAARSWQGGRGSMDGRACG